MSKLRKRYPPDKIDVLQKYWVEAEQECGRLRAALKEIAENSHEGGMSESTLECCTHAWHDKDVAVDADGYCPLCQAEELDRLRARVAELEARVRPVNGYGIALMMIAEGVDDPRQFAKDTLAKWRPIIDAGIST